jgi:hypothetical protein
VIPEWVRLTRKRRERMNSIGLSLMKEARDLFRILKAQAKFLLLHQSILTGPICMIDQLKIYMDNQTSKESTK